MKTFITENFLLHNDAARRLYFDYAAKAPIIDYHNHLPPKQMADDYRFDNLTQVWLYGDHYKWRAMRTQGVNEKYCTGNATDKDKFLQWAATVPFTIRNPLYHWTHLELLRYFGIDNLLDTATANDIYQQCNEMLQQPSYSTMGLLRQMNVRLLCTTDDPIDDLTHHDALLKRNDATKVLPAFRPDKAMAIEQPESFSQYVENVGLVTNKSIHHFQDYLEALHQRHDYFASKGCTISDHGLEHLYAETFTEKSVSTIFDKARIGGKLTLDEVAEFKSAMLYYFAVWNWEKGWVQQFHLGALRNNNARLVRNLGPDTGWDSIGDFPQAVSLSRFLRFLDNDNKLAKTILYNLNPADNELMATMTGNFNDGSMPGKIQWGSAWWFLDQKDGIIQHLNTLSNMGLISRFIGMLTDSRSFLSFPRHEYFRRILCNLLGAEMQSGELPMDYLHIGKIIGDICYNNARQYFGFEL